MWKFNLLNETLHLIRRISGDNPSIYRSDSNRNIDLFLIRNFIKCCCCSLSFSTRICGKSNCYRNSRFCVNLMRIFAVFKWITIQLDFSNHRTIQSVLNLFQPWFSIQYLNNKQINRALFTAKFLIYNPNLNISHTYVNGCIIESRMHTVLACTPTIQSHNLLPRRIIINNSSSTTGSIKMRNVHLIKRASYSAIGVGHFLQPPPLPLPSPLLCFRFCKCVAKNANYNLCRYRHMHFSSLVFPRHSPLLH